MHYFLLIAEEYPSFAEENSFLFIQEQDSGVQILEVIFAPNEKDSENKAQTEELSFMTTLVVNSDEPEPIVQEFKKWWDDNAGGQIDLELLTTEMDALNAERAEYVRSLEPGQWSIKSSFVAYRSISRPAYEAARDIVIASEFNIQ